MSNLNNDFIDILKDTKVREIDYKYTNPNDQKLDNLIANIYKYYVQIIDSFLTNKNYYYLNFHFANYFKLKFIIEDQEIKIKLFDSNIVENYIYDLFGITPFTKQDIKEIFNEIKKISTIDELKLKYPNIYGIYSEILNNNEKSKKLSHFRQIMLNNNDVSQNEMFVKKTFIYSNNINKFLNDMCDYFSEILDKKDLIDNEINNNLYKLTINDIDIYYNLIFLLVLEYIKQTELTFALTNDLEDKNYSMNLIKKIISKQDTYNKPLILCKRDTNEIITLEDIKNQLFNENKKDVSGPNEDIVDYIAYSHNEKYSFPLLNDDEMLAKIMKINNLNPDEVITQFYLLKNSGLFEIAYSNCDEFKICLKKEYDHYSIDDLFEIALNNLRKLQEKNITFIPNRFVTKIEFNESRFIKYLNSDENRYNIYHVLFKLLKENIKFNTEQAKEFNNSYLFCLSVYYYSLVNDVKDYSDIDLTNIYIYYIKNFNNKYSKFIKFVDKSFLREEDFVNLDKKVKSEIETRIGIDKLNEILDKVKDVNNPEEINNIIKNCLLQKKSISDEIKMVEQQKSKTPKNSKEYVVLNQRLNKLLMYKNHYDSEEVIPGEGPVFKDYDGFDFGGIIVFDFFVNDEEVDVLTKAKRGYGHRIYILTEEDYLKVKDLKTRNEINSFIQNHLKPCADSMYHGENEELRLMEKIKGVRLSLEKKNYVVNLAKSDNPVTDEEITITQEEFEFYASKFISTDQKEIDKLKKKSKKFQSRESLEREQNICDVESWKKEQEAPISEEEETEAERNKSNLDIEILITTIQKLNIEREKKGLEPLSFDTNNYYDVYKAIIDYEKENNIKIKARRDPKVALVTKERTYYNNSYHCELCGETELNPIYLESHHFIPISQGGPDDIYNTVCLCTRCHKAIHNGLVTDYQNYMLISTIRDFITSKVPEALAYFEETLGFQENKYLEQIDKIEEDIISIKAKEDEVLSSDKDEDEQLSEYEKLEDDIKLLEDKKQKLLIYANRIQDYYRNSDEYKEIEERTDFSSIQR